MPKVAYRLLPSDDDGSENSQLTLIKDEAESIGVGSVIDADLLGHLRWEVVEIREDSGGLVSASSEGTLIPLRGTLVCRAVGEHS